MANFFHQKVPKVSGPLTDRSVTIGSAGVVQSGAAAFEGRIYLFIQNVSDTAMWIDFDGTTAVGDKPSIRIDAGASLVYEGSFVPNGAVSVFCAAGGKKLVIKEA